MKWSKCIVVLAALLASAGCHSQYGSRMVRVKSQPKSELKSTSNYKTIARLEKAIHSEQDFASQKEEISAQTDIYSVQVEDEVTKKNVRTSHPKQIVKKIKAKYLAAKAEPQDSVLSTEPNEEFIKEQYRKANKMTFTALALLLISPYTILLSLIGAIILSLKALKIYRAYENPGVNERYILAYAVLILSCLVVLLSFGLLYILAVL